jgi:hypothetical protein
VRPPPRWQAHCLTPRAAVQACFRQEVVSRLANPSLAGYPGAHPAASQRAGEGVGAPVALPASARRSAALRVGAAALAGVTAPINVLRFSEATRMRAGLGASPGKRIMPPFLVVAANEFRRARPAAVRRGGHAERACGYGPQATARKPLHRLPVVMLANIQAGAVGPNMCISS